MSETEVTKVYAFYYRGNNILSVRSNVVGEFNSSKEEKLMIVDDKNSRLLNKNDNFELNDTKYRIIDLGNSFDLYFEVTVERVT